MTAKVDFNPSPAWGPPQKTASASEAENIESLITSIEACKQRIVARGRNARSA